MTGEKDIWDEKPPLLRNAGTIEVGVNPKFLDWLENLKAKITQLNECLGEYESKEWCDHCIIDSKCAQITLHVQELKEKAEKWDEFCKCLKWHPGTPISPILLQFHALNEGNQDKRKKLEAIKTLFLPLPEWIEWEEGPMSIEASKMLKLKKILEAEE